MSDTGETLTIRMAGKDHQPVASLRTHRVSRRRRMRWKVAFKNCVKRSLRLPQSERSHFGLRHCLRIG